MPGLAVKLLLELGLNGRRWRNLPLNTRENSCYVVCRAPSVLQDIQAKLSRGINVRVEHLADELDCWRLVGVLLLELHHQSKCSIFERCVCRTNNDGVPCHDIIGYRRGRHASGRIGLHTLFRAVLVTDHNSGGQGLEGESSSP